MLALLCGTIWAGVVIYLLSLVMRQFRAYRATAIDASVERSSSPSVSIIVPVRNEIDNVAHCLDGLTAQTGLSSRSEIIVVDDASDDGTVTVVEHYTSLGHRVRLSAAGPLPEGWVGKPHACRRGALPADADWLCFIDADVRAAPELVSTAIDAAEAHGIDMLSLHPFQELGRFLGAGRHPRRVFDDRVRQGIRRNHHSEPISGGEPDNRGVLGRDRFD